MTHKWVLKKSAAKRFETGHPWVFSNELEGVKGPDAGDVVDLVNSSGRFLARGFANPGSLIAFRKLTLGKEDITLSWVKNKILEKRLLRDQMGLAGSRRIVHGESDGLPGFIVDEFVSAGKSYWSVHLHSAGMERLLRHVSAADFFNLFKDETKLSGMVIRRDSKSRELEGLKILEPEVAGEVPDELNIDVDVGHLLQFSTSLKTGQKGGFFLDQRRNVSWLRDFLKDVKFQGSVKILDAFCYCGQWGVGVGDLLQSRKNDSQVTFADSSKPALKSAGENAKRYSIKAKFVDVDLVDGDWPVGDDFDLVIVDPPALIKSKKHYFAGRRAYLKVILRGLNALKTGGIFVASSCSFHLSREDLREVLLEASQIIAAPIKIMHEFSSPPDHLRSPEFPEGDYLKGFVCLKLADGTAKVTD
jgi:23S rRNA (cytosine1962-C5)-methyltransferase